MFQVGKTHLDILLVIIQHIPPDPSPTTWFEIFSDGLQGQPKTYTNNLSISLIYLVYINICHYIGYCSGYTAI